MDKEIVFKTKVDTGNTVKDINNIDKALKEVNKTVKDNSVDSQKAFDDLNAKVESGTLSMREMTRAVKEYQTIALQAGENSPIGKQAIEQAGQLKDRLGDLQQQVVNTGQDGKHLQGALSIGSGIVAGYGAVQSSMALVGADSKELEKTLIKLTAVTTLLNSVNEIRALFERQSAAMITLNAVKTGVMTVVQYAYTTAVGTTTGAMKLLRLSMLAVPIFAVIAGIIALVEVMDMFGESTKEAAAKQKAFEEQQAKSLKASQDYLTRNLKTTQDTHDKKLELMKIQGASSDEIYKKEKENLEFTQRQLESQNKFGVKMNAEQYKLYKDTLQAKKVLEATHQKEITDSEEKNAEDRKKNNEKRKAEKLQAEKDNQAKLLELTRLTEDLVIQNIQDSGLRQIAALNTQHERETEDLIAKYGRNSALMQELEIRQATELEALKTDIAAQQTEKDKAKLDRENTDAKARIEAKIINLRADFEAEQGAKIELANLELAQALQDKSLTDGEIQKLHAEHKQKIDDINTDSKNKEIENQKAIQDAGIEIGNKSIQAVQGLSDLVFAVKSKNLKKGSEEELKAAKKQFEINKSLQIGQAVIQGIQATLAAFSSGVATPIIGPATGAVFAGIAAITSAASIAKISSTTFEGARGGGGGATSPSVPAPSLPNPNTSNNTSGSISGTASNTLNAIDTSTGIKVSVVDSEIKAVMDKSAKTNVISTIG